MAVKEEGRNRPHEFPHKRIDGCLSAAVELVSLLKEESTVLKSFDADRLLRLLPRKEFLVNDLFRRLRMLETCDAEKEDAPFPSKADSADELKDLLQTIERLNGFNRIFLQQSLNHWRQFMAAVDHPGYGPRDAVAGAALLQKGFNFRGEA